MVNGRKITGTQKLLKRVFTRRPVKILAFKKILKIEGMPQRPKELLMDVPLVSKNVALNASVDLPVANIATQ